MGCKKNMEDLERVSSYISSYTIGRIGEDIAKRKLIKSGFKFSPVSLHFCLNGCIAVFKNPKRIEAGSCPYYSHKKPGCPKGEKWMQLMSFTYELLKDKFPFSGGNIISGKGRKTRAIFLDNLVEKDGNEYLVEVKTNTGRTTPWQEEVIKKAKILGFKVILVKCRVKLMCKVNVEELN